MNKISNKYKDKKINERIYFSDFDDTLKKVQVDHCHDENLLAFKRLKENGAITCLITGRPFLSFNNFITNNMKEAFNYIATDNGSLLFEVKDNKLELIFENALANSDISTILEFIEENNVSCIFNTNKNIYKICGNHEDKLSLLTSNSDIKMNNVKNIYCKMNLLFNLILLEKIESIMFNIYVMIGMKTFQHIHYQQEKVIVLIL